MDTKQQLRLGGYGSDDHGRLICFREPVYRYAHERVAVIQINAPKDFAAKVAAAIDEPAALVGIGRDHTLILFRAVKYDERDRLNFIVAKKQCSIFGTVHGLPFDVSEYAWTDGRSPLTVAHSALPPLFDDVMKTATDAVYRLLPEFGGRLGTMADLAEEQAREERHAKIAEEIAAGYWTDEAVQAREDDAIVAAHAGQDYVWSDGAGAMHILQARRRVARRAAEAASA